MNEEHLYRFDLASGALLATLSIEFGESYFAQVVVLHRASNSVVPSSPATVQRHEWFCHDVARIPVQGNMMTEVVDYDAGTPYC